ncbi:MAG: hypothetical protein JWL79_1314 [Frankiales bacterium]|nr:hypothetical protein [Frankiales bacterium]
MNDDELDRLLRGWGQWEAGNAGSLPPLRLGHPARRLLPVAAAALLVLATVVGITLAVGSGPGGSVGPGVTPTASAAAGVPWAPLPYADVVPLRVSPTPVVTGPPCQLVDLSLAFGDSDGAGGSIVQSVVVRAARTCRLSGPVSGMSALVGRSRTDVGVFQRGDLSGVITPEVPGLLAVEFGYRCSDYNPPRHLATYTAVRLTVLGHELDVHPGGRTAAWHPTADSLQMCAPAVVTTYGSGTAAPPPVVEHQPLNDLVATVEAPASAQAGTIVHFSVILTNPTSKPIGFGSCPSYIETVRTNKGSYQLNCPQATAIAAGQQERFEMELRLNADTPAGPAQLTWTLALITEGGSAPDPFHNTANLIITRSDSKPTSDQQGCGGPSPTAGGTPPPCDPSKPPIP